jgi:hypothetical protein
MPLNEELESIISSLVDSIEEEKRLVGAKDVVRALNDSAEYPINSAENFSLHVTLGLIDPMNGLIEEAAAENIKGYRELNETQQRRVKMLWARYQRAEHALAGMCEALNGTHVCSCDEARFILRRFELFLRGDTVEFLGFPPDAEREWYMPKHGSAKDWLDVAYGIVFNRYDEKYIGAVSRLAEQYGKEGEDSE